ncbi:DUF2927 domain-containing protein [Alisedimentitalea sp. MJ-SS2]|uniref:DUF2927 domain-containing protein n=1 Tax=Aliisedimentitalea sp. MJ-SS2 TaxID=3049795 RepID=UPI00290FBA78|nr:DUF2927 domain-containing protein [Alisedimentitalea sp. MJ-SS2]MDU8927443.1 DUF2927 domain-containing protein [Alisedimentitalea sp. MJ-SS2]
MKLGARLVRSLAALLGAGMLTACLAPAPTLKPQSRPAGLVPKPVAAPKTPSKERLALESHFARIQADHLARGLMRVDGGGPDTRFTAADLLTNFSRIAFVDEYRLGPTNANDTGYNRLRRWTKPIRMSVTFGKSISDEQRQTDSADIADYAARLSRLTGHPMSKARGGSANYHVMVMSLDDRDELQSHIRRIVPNASRATLSLFRNLPRSTHCLVWAQPSADNAAIYDSAIILIRAEHPHLGRKSCIHEEMAQGLGLIKDSPKARPSIFNDDEEFAYLTTHDEMLLKMLYDPRLQPGMSFDQARPIAMTIAAELTGNMY